MKPSFKLDVHSQRPRPLLSEPPAGYFDQLPTRIMARLPQAEARGTTAGRWWALLAPAWRTGLASVAVLGSFAASFWLSDSWPARPGAAPTAALDAVPRTELVGYLLGSEANVQATDLAELLATQPHLAEGSWRASDAEIQNTLDAQPTDDTVLL
ncbi:MAG TPA: hypothetical protein VF690_00515 [Hymenobacter sp.]|jgi:hypothetical protein